MKTLLCNTFIKSCRVEDQPAMKNEGPRLFIPNLPKNATGPYSFFKFYINIWTSSPFGSSGKTISNNIPLLMRPRSKSKFRFITAKPFRGLLTSLTYRYFITPEKFGLLVECSILPPHSLPVGTALSALHKHQHSRHGIVNTFFFKGIFTFQKWNSRKHCIKFILINTLDN